MEFGAFKIWLIVAALSPIGVLATKHFTKDPAYRLPTNFKPISYILDVTTHLEPNFTFQGVVNIRMACLESQTIMVLQVSSLNIDKSGITITDSYKKKLMVNSVWAQPHLDKFYINCYKKFQPGEEFVLSIPFSGKITEEEVGYYRSSYVDKKTNQTKWLAVTRFDPAHARRAFPCIDEPAYKATFKVKLRHEKGLTANSITRLVKTSPDPSIPNFVVDEFEESVPISTHQLAYMVSDFVYVDSGVVPHVGFRVLSRKDAVGQAKLARFVAPLIWQYYEDYLDQKFPISKTDLVAVPDLGSDAVANWGLVMFREASLLVDPKTATVDDTYRVVRTIAQELAQMLFDNLITKKWWSDLWLNKAFATYFASRALNELYPTWKTFRMEMVENFNRLLSEDSKASSYSLSMTVSKPDEVVQIYDTISQTKGSNLLHTANLLLGEKTFKQGIRNFIRKYKFAADVTHDDLWNAMMDEAHRSDSLPENTTFKEIMDPWILQSGYPVVIVTRDYITGIVNITQVRSFDKKSGRSGRKLKNCWWVPLTMTTSQEANFTSTKPYTWLSCMNKNTSMELHPDVPWVIFNLQMAGLYRVHYDLSNWFHIIYKLHDVGTFKTIPTLNRAQLISDSLAFARSGYLHYSMAIKLCLYLENEDEYIPWMTAIRGLSTIDRMLKRKPDYPIFQKYMLRILTMMYYKYHHLTVKIDDPEEMRLKKLVISHVCKHEIKNCTEPAQELFREWMESPDPDRNNILPKELRSTIYCVAAKYGGEKVWYFLLERYMRSNVASDKLKYLRGMSCTMEAWKLKKFLDWTIDKKDIIRKQDALFVFKCVSMNKIGHFLAKTFLLERVQDISRYFHPRGEIVGKYMEIISAEMKTTMELAQIRKLIKNNTLPFMLGSEISICKTMETIRFNIKWIKDYYNHVVEHLDVFRKPDFGPKPPFNITGGTF